MLCFFRKDLHFYQKVLPEVFNTSLWSYADALEIYHERLRRHECKRVCIGVWLNNGIVNLI